VSHRARGTGESAERHSGETYQPTSDLTLPPATERKKGDRTTVAPEAWRALERAAASVHGSWQYEGADVVTADEVVEPLEHLSTQVRRACGGDKPVLRHFPSTVPARRLLDGLRRFFLQHASTGETAVGAEDVVRVLCAMEEVAGIIDADSAQRFAGRLVSADAMQLIVEVAHDMRSPLGSILFLAERLRSGQSGQVSPIQERQLGLVYSAAFGLSSLASDVIELARGGDKLVDHQPIPFSIAEILQSVRDIVEPIAEEKGLTLRLAPPENDARIGYPAALNRVLLNLTTNALKFTASGSVEVVCRQLSRTKIEFSVKDTGRGIPPQVLVTLFDAFRRRQRPGDYTFSSAGLGLSICQKLVHAMSGELQVETQLEKGTRFFFALDMPLAPKM
jgi:signal transduction histidine kinase